ncbi:hypothetical protein DENIS_3739 [Desulfonema ishimotonii]|uniref:Calcineurin-like phosphoesterase domain-containing protein n=1 Tax=Desulfonema ishimotonii TaxID=45657 RepID=A0A401G0K4_9BACT|nr:metallophosphoesterase [Desulfonema ishimotonii]GBC62762.1 hypothetical protein DENIS_3739 [Desulfonema ishimotonii]
MIIVTDAHISSAAGNSATFFEMLRAFEETAGDLIFLGDIFDLWIALPGFEQEIHREFLAWCRTQKGRRKIGFIEGNHEFFLARKKGDAFSWCTDGPCRDDGRGHLFCHGDQINRKDRNYLRFRRLVRNSVTRMLLKHIPLGPELAEQVRRGMKNTNPVFRKMFPENEITAFGKDCFRDRRVRTVFVGHFHREYVMPFSPGRRLYLLPDWLSTEKVALYREATGEMILSHWREMPV